METQAADSWGVSAGLSVFTGVTLFEETATKERFDNWVFSSP